LEKQVFLEILKDYKHVIESKGTNSSTLKEKAEAWFTFTKTYNDSSLICTKVLNLFSYFYTIYGYIYFFNKQCFILQRDVQQLKKYLWVSE
ncbi:hypothetical protein ALC60_07232, partial [Trachymyrmex zeteki]